jgi:flavin-dependent dehydrogenase
MYDVCIIGAGPAGSTLARIIGTRYRTLLVDRRPLDYEWAPGVRGKLCGGLLAPRAQAELARQGLGVPRCVVAGPQLFAVRTLDLEADLERLYQRFYVSVDRERFDRWLVSLVPASVDVAMGWRAESIDTAAGMPLVTFATPGGGRASVEARLVVGADGAGSLARRVAATAGRTPRAYTAVQAVFSASWSEPHYGAVFDRRLTEFYGWTIPRGDTLVAGAAFGSAVGAHDRFDRFVSSLRAHGFALGEERSRAAARVVRPARPGDVTLGANAVALVGEAAGLISPSSAEGEKRSPRTCES